MNFTHIIKTKPGPALCGILTIAVVAVLGWGGQSAPAPTPIVVPQAAVPSGDAELVAQAAAPPESARAQTPHHVVSPKPVQAAPHQSKASHHRSWKKPAAIIGGSAAGGALIGGLAGGGKGVIVGGLLGGGGGYLYNRFRRHHHHNQH